MSFVEIFSPLVVLRRPSRTPFESFPTPWSSFADPLPDLWRIPLEPPPTPSWPFAVLRGPSWISFCLFVEILSPLPDLWRNPLEPPPTPSWPFAVLRGPSWISFCLFVEILSPLPDPWRIPLEPPPTPSWPFAVLRGPSWISFCLFLFALRGYLLRPFPTFGGSLSSLLQPLSTSERKY